MALSAYRALGSSGDFPPWLQELATRKCSGVYAIKLRGRARPVYVGESHTGSLYDTLTRHVQRWHRAKRWWHGIRGHQQHDPGVIYRRGDVLVAFETATPKRALQLQETLIRRLRPRDNVVGKPEPKVELPPAPF